MHQVNKVDFIYSNVKQLVYYREIGSHVYFPGYSTMF